jgi:hypothetical protein
MSCPRARASRASWRAHRTAARRRSGAPGRGAAAISKSRRVFGGARRSHRRLPLMRVSDRLTDIAELIVQCCMDLAWQQMTKIYGVPRCGDSEGTARVVKSPCRLRQARRPGARLRLGSRSRVSARLGGREPADHGARPIDNGVFFLRLGQRIVHLLTMHSAGGTALRGRHAPAAERQGRLSHDGHRRLRALSAPDAWTWEHQALLRARAVAGDAALRALRGGAAQRALHGRAPRYPARRREGDAPTHAQRAVEVGCRAVRHQAGCRRHRRHRVPGAVLGPRERRARIRSS